MMMPHCVTIDTPVDIARDTAERLHFEEHEKAMQKAMQDEAFAIDDKIDELTDQDIFDATDNLENWKAFAQLCANSQATKDNYERLGRVIGQLVRDYAIKAMEKESE